MGKILFGLWFPATESLEQTVRLQVMLADCGEKNGFWNTKIQLHSKVCSKIFIE
jgi:hypothetical protein